VSRYTYISCLVLSEEYETIKNATLMIFRAPIVSAAFICRYYGALNNSCSLNSIAGMGIYSWIDQYKIIDLQVQRERYI
jgi:hypothetical protein